MSPAAKATTPHTYAQATGGSPRMPPPRESTFPRALAGGYGGPPRGPVVPDGTQTQDTPLGTVNDDDTMARPSRPRPAVTTCLSTAPCLPPHYGPFGSPRPGPQATLPHRPGTHVLSSLIFGPSLTRETYVTQATAES
ncbi:hypothetical protein GCM10023085_25420 [Actinomadura viridis]